MSEEYPNMHLNATPKIFMNASALRKNMTVSEKRLWEQLRNKKLNGLKFRRQHPILTFILDFYCHSIKLGVEIDGRHHHQEDQNVYDKTRTQALAEYGIRILRFTNEEIDKNIQVVIKEIESATRTPRSPEGEELPT